MSDSNRPERSGKSTRRKLPKKPRPDFPLSIQRGLVHSYWKKRINGVVYYFGNLADDPKGKKALEKYLAEKDDLEAGRDPKSNRSDSLTIKELVNHFLTHQKRRRDDGEISPRTFQCLDATCGTIVKVFKLPRSVETLTPADFGKLKQKLSNTRKAISLRNEMQRVRSVFLYAYTNGLIDRPVVYGTKFDKPPLKMVRKAKREHRQEHGDRMFEANELRMILGHLSGESVVIGTNKKTGKPIEVEGKSNPALRAMTLLAINMGLGQTDVASLPRSAIDFKKQTVDFPRPKTEADRFGFLWSETIEAIEAWLPKRPRPKDPADRDLIFITKYGHRFVSTGNNGIPIDSVGNEFSKVLNVLKLKRKGVSFYAIRHSFRTVADEVLDPVAVGLVMGHTDASMAGHYREKIGEERLKRVADHVHAWLFPVAEDETETDLENDAEMIS